MSSLCRDVLNHPRLFPARNARSFMQTLAEVYDHLQLQLRDVLEHERTCAELAARALCLGRNLVSDTLAYLLTAATELRQTDHLASLEVVSLWAALPEVSNPCPKQADPVAQKAMADAWQTLCGSIVAALLCMPCTQRLFNGPGNDSEAKKATTATLTNGSPHDDAVAEKIDHVATEFNRGRFQASGLAGPFREPTLDAARRSFIDACRGAADLVYLLGEVLTQFHRISDGLGDYGMVRVSMWLHPCLDAMKEKTQRIKHALEELNQYVDNELVIARARGRKIKKPAPSECQSSRAHSSISRAVIGRDCHSQALLRVLEELRASSSAERLPHVMEGLGEACVHLRDALSSRQFRLCVGPGFPELPPLGTVGGTCGTEVEKVDIRMRRPSILELEDISEADTRSTASRGEYSDQMSFAIRPSDDLNGWQEPTGNPERVRSACFAEPLEAPATPVGELRAMVARLKGTPGPTGKKVHDHRLLLLRGRHLMIYDKNSTETVKTVVNVASDLEECCLLGAGVLSLQLQRTKPASGLSCVGSAALDVKIYHFEFSPPRLAKAFHTALTSLQENGTW